VRAGGTIPRGARLKSAGRGLTIVTPAKAGVQAPRESGHPAPRQAPAPPRHPGESRGPDPSSGPPLPRRPGESLLFLDEIQVCPKALAALRHYVFVGGMPEAVQAYANHAPLLDVQRIQASIVGTVEDDFAKYGSRAQQEILRKSYRYVARNVGRAIRECFDAVTDTVRGAALMATGRSLSPGQLRETCRAGLLQILD